ncbi:uncharacterized protein [Triticum aestivum]|uniref:uncharacterized protein n=1 Tax=Triticum aestivum TaxID=4565 RepID=UPI001D01ABBD|nr:uncharacterized protein LOC123104308 [Triticum aestivum]
MHPELKSYLADYHARTMARYDAVDKQHARMLKILTGVSTPQLACPMGTAADGGLTDDPRAPAVVHDVFSTTTQAQETPAVSHDAPSVRIERVPATCSTECLTQVASIASVGEVHDAATAAQLEPVDDHIHQEVASEIITPVATTTEVNPKTSVQELDDSPLPCSNNSTQVVSEADHIVVLLVPNNLAALAPSKCLAECSAYVGDWVKPLTATIDSVDETHDTPIAERLHPPSFERHQPWRFNHMGSIFRPSPWPSFGPLSVTSYPEEPCSSIHSQSHRGSCFSPWLVRLMFRDVHLEEHGNGTDSVKPCTSGIQHKVRESFTEIARRCSFDVRRCSPGDGPAIAREFDVPLEIKKMDKGCMGSSVAAYVLPLERYEPCKYQFFRESSMTDFPAEFEVEYEAEYYVQNTTPGLVGREDDLNLWNTDGCSAGIDSNNTVVVADSKSDKISDS